MARKIVNKKLKSIIDVGVDNPLDMVPTLALGVEAKADQTKQLQVRRRMQPKPGFAAWFARQTGQSHEIRINLDEMGTFYFQQVDGRQDLAAIANALSRKFNLEHAKCREAVIQYSRLLIEKKLLYLKVPEHDAQAPESETEACSQGEVSNTKAN